MWPPLVTEADGTCGTNRRACWEEAGAVRTTSPTNRPNARDTCQDDRSHPTTARGITARECEAAQGLGAEGGVHAAHWPKPQRVVDHEIRGARNKTKTKKLNTAEGGGVGGGGGRMHGGTSNTLLAHHRANDAPTQACAEALDVAKVQAPLAHHTAPWSGFLPW